MAPLAEPPASLWLSSRYRRARGSRGDLLGDCPLGGSVAGGSFHEHAGFEAGAGTDQGDEVGALTARQRVWAGSISL